MDLLITGATGLLGQAVVPRLLERGHRLTLLVRDQVKAARLFPGCDLVQGDVTLDGFGLERPPRPDAVWHMAADISLGSSHDSRVWAVNYQGTVNAVNFCLRNSVRRLFYAGTAYTEKGRNIYEKSKKAAELFVEASAIEQKTIFKIGILVQPEKDAASVPAGGFYMFLNGLAKVLRRAPAGQTFRIKGLPGAGFNLVHTDIVADFMAAADKPGKFWLTHPDPVKLRELAEWVGELLGATIKFEPDFEMTREEALLHKISRPFMPYMWGDDFPSHLSGIPRVTANFIKESAAAGIAAAHGEAAS